MVCRLKKQGMNIFTLIKLLVVIAIIAILASMLLPALNKARENAWGSLCMGNLKTCAQALNMYADDYKDFFPLAQWTAGDGKVYY